jgi:hypothetical protein
MFFLTKGQASPTGPTAGSKPAQRTYSPQRTLSLPFSFFSLLSPTRGDHLSEASPTSVPNLCPRPSRLPHDLATPPPLNLPEPEPPNDRTSIPLPSSLFILTSPSLPRHQAAQFGRQSSATRHRLDLEMRPVHEAPASLSTPVTLPSLWRNS